MKSIPRFGLLLMLVAVAGFFLVLRPQMKTFGEKSLKYKALKIEEESYRQRVKDIEVISQQQNMAQILNARYLALPRTSQVPEVLVMVEDFGNNAGVVLTTATVSKPTGNEVPVSLAFTGKLDNVTSFLNTIYQNARTARIKNQSVSTDKEGNLSVTLQLGLIYQGSGEGTTAQSNTGGTQ